MAILISQGCTAILTTTDEIKHGKNAARYGCRTGYLGLLGAGGLVDVAGGYSLAYDKDKNSQENFRNGSAVAFSIIVADIFLTGTIHEIFFSEPPQLPPVTPKADVPVVSPAGRYLRQYNKY